MIAKLDEVTKLEAQYKSRTAFFPQSGLKSSILKVEFKSRSDPFGENRQQNNNADRHTEQPKTKCTHIFSPSQIELVTSNNELT